MEQISSIGNKTATRRSFRLIWAESMRCAITVCRGRHCFQKAIILIPLHRHTGRPWIFSRIIVLIKLGTNDTKPQNWRFHHEFEADYQKLIEQFRNLDSHPRIILLVPVRCFLTDETSISPLRISQSVRPAVEQIAWKNGLEILNLYSLFGDNWEPHLMPDRLHPSAIGAGRMAQVIGAYLKQAYATCHTQDMPFLKDAATFNFHGYCGYDFWFEGVNCKIVKPYGEAPGKPWVIRARFWGHEPQTDIALLEHGFHIMYCDVADMYGSPEAVKRWNRFYKK